MSGVLIIIRTHPFRFSIAHQYYIWTLALISGRPDYYFEEIVQVLSQLCSYIWDWYILVRTLIQITCTMLTSEVNTILNIVSNNLELQLQFNSCQEL